MTNFACILISQKYTPDVKMRCAVTTTVTILTHNADHLTADGLLLQLSDPLSPFTINRCNFWLEFDDWCVIAVNIVASVSGVFYVYVLTKRLQ